MEFSTNVPDKDYFYYTRPFLLNQILVIIILCFSLSFAKQQLKISGNLSGNDSSIVAKYGQLRVQGTKIVNKIGNPVSLHGMSMFWSQWMGRFYNYNCVKWLRDDFKCTVVRAALGVESGGYLQNPDLEFNKIKTVIDACIDLGIYVIVDWHDDNAQNYTQQSISFFKQIATLYGNQPNIIYEIYNEPQLVSWTKVVKPYAISVIEGIRSIDPDNIIVVGTPTWSQDVDTASRNPLEYENIAYSLHFYAASHKQSLRNKAITAINNGIALFVTEWGTCESTGDGYLDYVEVENWMNFMNSNKLSWCNWSVADKVETSAALKPNVSSDGNWLESSLTPSGTLVRGKSRSYPDTTSSYILINENLPLNFELNQNYPNPFNPSTIIKYSLPFESTVVFKIFNSLGQNVREFNEGIRSKGKYEFVFNAAGLTSGIYLFSINTRTSDGKNNFSAVKKMILLK